MIQEPRFLIYNEIPYLVNIIREKGEIVDIHGPYQCVGGAGMTAEELVKDMHGLMLKALHAEKPIAFEDLPQALQDKIMGVKEEEKQQVNG